MTGDPSAFALAVCGTGRGRGQIALAACPGRAGLVQSPHLGDRLLQRDTATIARWGAQALVTLLDSLEMARLRLQALPPLLGSHRIVWHHLPLDPRQAPNPSFEQSWRSLSQQLADLVRDGGRVAIHCRDGRTRTGMVAALLLVELGCAPQDAINRVRAARPGSLELTHQEDYVRAQVPAPRSADIYQLDLLDAAGAAPAHRGSSDEQMVVEPIRVKFAQQG